jgi:hypothetical protein
MSESPGTPERAGRERVQPRAPRWFRVAIVAVVVIAVVLIALLLTGGHGPGRHGGAGVGSAARLALVGSPSGTGRHLA